MRLALAIVLLAASAASGQITVRHYPRYGLSGRSAYSSALSRSYRDSYRYRYYRAPSYYYAPSYRGGYLYIQPPLYSPPATPYMSPYRRPLFSPYR